jgi:hypothetical protein
MDISPSPAHNHNQAPVTERAECLRSSLTVHSNPALRARRIMPFRHEDTSPSAQRILKSFTTYSILLGRGFSLMGLTVAQISLKTLDTAWRNALWRTPSLDDWTSNCCSNDALTYSISLWELLKGGARRSERCQARAVDLLAFNGQ